MVSRTKVTENKRARRHKNMGARRKAKTANKDQLLSSRSTKTKQRSNSLKNQKFD